jgi:polygalacturonase
VAVRPTAREIKATVKRNRISFRLNGPGPVTVEVNGTHYALHLFPSPAAAAAPGEQEPGVKYFGPGVHRPGRMTLESNQTIYIAGGAVVYGSIQANNASNIRILGRGILDTSGFPRGQGRGCVRLNNCQNVTIEGVILRDPDTWCLTLQGCSKVSISNVKEIGLWRMNSDGMDVCNSEDVTIRDCFIRSFDDSIVIKGMRGRGGGEPKSVHRVTAERCVLWNDWGRALEIGAETACPEMTDITFRDCDVIHTDFAALDIQHGDKAAIRNVLYDNVRFEIDDVNYEPVMWHGEGEKYVPNSNWCPRLLVIEIVKTVWNRDSDRGTVDGVTLRNVHVTGKPFPPSRIQGFDANHPVKDVKIENLRINNRLIRTVEEASIIVKPFVEGLKVKAD